MSLAEVFIIESLSFENERNQRDGYLLYQSLKMYNKKPKYYYIRTKKEFLKVMNFFQQSKYRYLHLSCHGSTAEVSLTLDSIAFKEFGIIISPFLDNRRLFVSSCELVNRSFAKQIFPVSRCYSIVGPSQKINFTTANISWMTFYHLMFGEDDNKMKDINIKKQVATINKTFNARFKYYKPSGKSKEGFASVSLD